MSDGRRPSDRDRKISLEGGRVIDPKNGLNADAHVLIDGAAVESVSRADSAPRDAARIDVSGCYVTPGCIDIHTHLFYTAGNPHAWAGEYSVPPDVFSFKSGATTMVDTGSAGWRNFPVFRASVIERSRTRVFALLNIASYGMINDMIEQYPADFDPGTTAAVAREHDEVVVGIKTAHYFHPDWTSVDRAVATGEIAGIPVMVDFGYFRKERPYWELVEEHLRPGDICTHCFRAPVPVADESGRVYDYLWEARRRGIRFDLGHGEGSFIFRNAVPAVRAGFYPDSISTDFHGLSMNSGLVDLPNTMSKLMAIGMPLPEVVRATTWEPAQMIGHPELGHLSPGAPADIAVWELETGTFGFKDTVGGRLTGEKRLRCVMTIKDGRIAWDRDARDGVDYRTLPEDTGIREGEFRLRPPAGS